MKVKRAIIIGALMIALVIFICIWIAGGLLTAPASQPVGNLPSDIHGESIQFSSESASTIHGWLIPGPKQGGAVVLMHVVRGNRTSMLERARFLSHAGYTVLLFDFQAHGESPGAHITFGYAKLLIKLQGFVGVTSSGQLKREFFEEQYQSWLYA